MVATTARISAVPVPDFDRDVVQARRVIDQNFSRIADVLNRAIAAGSLILPGGITIGMLASSVKTFAGDLSGTLPTGVVVGMQSKTLAAPAAGDDGKAITYNHGGSAWAYTSLMTNPLTTRGDLVYRNATVPARLAVGTANQVLKSDGTDPGWGGVSALLDAVFSSTQGSVLYRGAASWAALGPGTSGHYLKTLGAAADPAWASVAAGSSPLTTKGDLYVYTTVDARLAVGTDGQVLTADAASAAGVKWAAAASAGTNALLDGSAHSDTLAGTVVRGDVVYGNSTPKWARLALGGAGKELYSDGTDISWKRPRFLRADKPTPVATYFGNGVATNNGPSTRTDAGGSGVTAETTDSSRPCVKFTQTVNTGTAGSSWSTHIKSTHSPAMWADFKQVSFSKQGLMIGFNSNGISGAGPYAGAPHCVELGWLDGTDTNYQVAHAKGAAPTKSDTGVAKDTNWHDVLIYTPDAGTTWKVELDGVEVYSGTTNLPTTSTSMAPVQGIACVGAGSTGNELRCSYCIVQCNNPITNGY